MMVAGWKILLVVGISFLLGADRSLSVPLRSKEGISRLLWKHVKNAVPLPVAKEPVAMDPIPDHVDWREKGVIPEVANQGQLGQAFVFAIVHAIDAYWAIHHNNQLIYGSVTEVVECCTRVRNATIDSIYSCIVRIGGLASDNDYPKGTSGKCLSQLHKPVIFIDGHRDVDHFNENALAAAVATMPVVALMDASRPSFQAYKSGIYTDQYCSTTELDHAVLVVGYGTMDGKDYWLCQNSWGKDWGMDGYFMIARNAGNMCGIATMASYPD